jgi:hypothetical protein
MEGWERSDKVLYTRVLGLIIMFEKLIIFFQDSSK